MMRTSKELPNTCGVKSQDLLVQAAFIRQISAGIYSLLHFGLRSIEKIERILDEEMERIGGVKVLMPVVHPAGLWQKTGRYEGIDEALIRFNDRTGKNLVLAMTHEEIVGYLAQSEIHSYRQLPLLIYQIQTKFRDELRSRAGLIRVREFLMKDSYSLDKDVQGLVKQYRAHYEAYLRIFSRLKLPVVAIESDPGMMGGYNAHEYMYLTEIGEDTIFYCENTSYMANKEVAQIGQLDTRNEEKAPLHKIYTPGKQSILALVDFLSVPAGKCGKVVFYSTVQNGESKLILAIVRGDMEVNENKLKRVAQIEKLQGATEKEILSVGCVPGFASPINIDRENTLVVADLRIPEENNLVMGANTRDYHFENVCYGRDFEADIIGDIIFAYAGAPAPNAKSPDDRLKEIRGIEVGNIFQLGTRYSDAFDAKYMSEQGRRESIQMGSYGIGLGRALGCLAEEYHDENGLLLPVSVAPYEVILLALLDNEEVIHKADNLYNLMKSNGIDVIYDDRSYKIARAGEKFADADLIGIPIRLTISKRSLKKGGIELKHLGEDRSIFVDYQKTIEIVQKELERLKSD